jgi:hypothetical protein
MASTSFGTNRGSAAKNLVTQGLVTMNVGNGESIVRARHETKGPNKFAPDTSFNGDAYAFDHVHQFQPLMVQRTQARRSLAQNLNMHSVGALTLEPFATFNGFDHEGKTREEIEDEIDVIGFAATPYTYGEPTQTDSGIAAIIAGSFTTQNTGTSLLMPGQLLQWKAYDMRATDEDRAALEAFHTKRRQTNAVSNSQPLGRYQPRIEPFDPNKEARLFLHNALRAELEWAASTPANAAELLNFDVLDNPALLRRLSPRRRMVMTKLRADLAFAASLREDLVSGGNALLGTGDVAGLITAVRRAYGLIPTDDAVKNATLARYSGDMHGVAIDAINNAARKVVAVSIGYSLPGGNIDVVV